MRPPMVARSMNIKGSRPRQQDDWPGDRVAGLGHPVVIDARRCPRSVLPVTVPGEGSCSGRNSSPKDPFHRTTPDVMDADLHLDRLIEDDSELRLGYEWIRPGRDQRRGRRCWRVGAQHVEPTAELVMDER